MNNEERETQIESHEYKSSFDYYELPAFGIES